MALAIAAARGSSSAGGCARRGIAQLSIVRLTRAPRYLYLPLASKTGQRSLTATPAWASNENHDSIPSHPSLRIKRSFSTMKSGQTNGVDGLDKPAKSDLDVRTFRLSSPEARDKHVGNLVSCRPRAVSLEPDHKRVLTIAFFPRRPPNSRSH